MPPQNFLTASADSEPHANLEYAPTHPREFDTLAVQMAEILRPGAEPHLATHDQGVAELPGSRDRPETGLAAS